MAAKVVSLFGRRPIAPSVRFAVLRRDGYRCTYCGARAPEVRLHVDHIQPVARGGTNHPSNLTTSCQPCNLGKGTGSALSGGTIFQPVCYEEQWYQDASGTSHMNRDYFEFGGDWQDSDAAWIDIVREWDGQEPIV